MSDIVYATPLPCWFKQQEKKTKMVWYSVPNIHSQTSLGSGEVGVFFGIEETLTWTKCQSIYLSKAFLEDVNKGAHGIVEEKTLVCMLPNQDW